MAGLRVLIIGPYPADLNKIVGGVEAVNVALADALSAHPEIDHVAVAHMYRKGKIAPEVQINPKLTAYSLKVPSFFTGTLYNRSWVHVQALKPLVRSFRPDLVHAHGIGQSGDVALQLGLPTVTTVHGLIHVEERMAAKTFAAKLKLPFIDMRSRRVLRDSHLVISISEYDARSLEGLVKQQRVSISNPISAAFFAPAGAPPAAPTVLFAGVMRPRKNVLGLVNAFAQVYAKLPTAKLVIAGPPLDQAYAAEVRARAEQLGISSAVQFLGHVSNEELLQAVRNTSVLALFSHEETSPTIIAQALAVGRPVVASQVGGIPEMVTPGETGWLVPAGDEAALADRLLAVLSDLPNAQQMGERGRSVARQRYEPASVADQTVRAYRAAIAAAQQRTGVAAAKAGTPAK
jgi:glycosyltransferase involved in cell wall biosynthesis